MATTAFPPAPATLSPRFPSAPSRSRRKGWRGARTLALGLALWAPARVHANAPAIMPARELTFRVQTENEPVRLKERATLWAQGWIGPLHEPVPVHAAPTSLHGRTPVNRYRWTRGGFRFVPQSDGWATLSFYSPATLENNTSFEGPIALGELFAVGASLAMNRLESEAGRNLTDGETPLPPDFQDAGRIVPRHGSVSARIRLTANRPVVVRFSARAVPPQGCRPMPRLPSSGTPAHAALRHFRRGVNLGNHLESPPEEDWGAQYRAADFDAILAEGFDHVRIPVAWHHHTGPSPEHEIDPEFFERVTRKVGRATERNLAVILNWQHFNDFTDAPDPHLDRFERVWVQIAKRYARFPGRIAFELLNEPCHAANTLAMNRVYERVVPALRAEAPDTTFFVSPGDWSRASELPALRLPAADSNLVVAVHHYDPFPFTHQGAHWAQPAAALTNIHFPGPGPAPLRADPATAGQEDWLNAYNHLPTQWNPCSRVALSKPLRLAQAWSDHYGRPVHIGEWGCIATAPAASRTRYYRAKRMLLDEMDLPWAIWDWTAHFRYWDQAEDQPLPGLRHALFPNPQSPR